MLSYIFNKTNRVIPATLSREGFRGYSRVLTLEQHNQKIFFFFKIKIYSDGILKDPVQDYETLEFMGYKKKYLLDKGILETTLLKTKNCVSSTVFEILVMDALPKKYDFVQKVIYCQDGALKFKCLNFTGQNNPDYAFDSKAQKMDSFITNLEKKGLAYQVVTIASTPDEFIQNHS